jgi:PqqD family protein of HPr-rel-A system
LPEITSATTTSDVGDPRRYRTADGTQLVWAELDGDFALYHRPSGKTHFLNVSSAYLLLTVLQQPRTVAEAAALLLEQQVDPVTDTQSEYLDDLLRRFAELGIVVG